MRRNSTASDNMSSCRIERKRAHDREAQRASRAKTKAYIAHLEKTVADLSQSSGDGRANYLAQHTSQQQQEIDNLQGLLGKIRTLVHDAAKADDANSSSPSRLKTEGSISESVGENSLADLFAAGGPWDSPNSDETCHEPAPIPQKKDAPLKPSKPAAATRNLLVLGVNMFCEDSADDYTYFTRLNEAVTKVEATPDNLSTIEVDEDILIRAVVHGWDAAERIHHFDIVWRFLRAFDEGLWYHAAPLERFAHFWQMRSTMLHKIQPKNQERRHTAPFMAPTLGQRSLGARPAIVDYFGWPQVRNHLLDQGILNCPDNAAVAFAKSFRFVWNFELRDVYKVNKSTGLYSFSEGFLKSWNDLSSFRMLNNDAIPYYVHPSLAQAAAPPSFERNDSDSSDGSVDEEIPSLTNDSVNIPSAESLMQDAIDAILPPYSMDMSGDMGHYAMDPYSMAHEATFAQWPGL